MSVLRPIIDLDRASARKLVLALVQAKMLWRFLSRLEGYNSMAPSAAAKGLGSWPLAPAMAMSSGRSSISAMRRRFSAVCRGRCDGGAHQLTAHPRLPHGRVGGLPRPVDSAQHVTGLDQDGPGLRPDSVLASRLDVVRHSPVVTKARRQFVAWAAGAQPEDEAIENPAQIHAAMPRGQSGRTRVEDQLDHRP